MSTLPERLARTRTSRGYTQAALAHEIRVSRGVITNIEYGKAEPSPIVLAAICRVLNVNEKWLLTGQGPMEPENERSKILDELYRVCANLTEPQQLFLLDTIRSMQKHLEHGQDKEHPPDQKQSLDDILASADKRRGTSEPGQTEPDRGR